MEEWSLTAVQAGFLASAALFGMMFGAMIFGTLTPAVNPVYINLGDFDYAA